eukprot:TRINITY_DN633_c0_g1_i4.p1 TRINITY_DN633_c0_g1~~TRINITY_DN633_c0_g1_i4.p1  ORF type:complete len:549 (+),score=16.91 TRINITY_DN633_c0_g1_i4:204-1850(+)
MSQTRTCQFLNLSFIFVFVSPLLSHIQGIHVNNRRLLQSWNQCLDSGIFNYIDPGCRTPGAEYEIFGGQVADLQKWPYLMSFQMERSSGDSNCLAHVCGGALIAPDVAITAAHCVEVGRWLNWGQFEGAPVRTVKATKAPFCRHLTGSEGHLNVRHIVIQPEWNSAELVGDIALIFLDQSLTGPYLNYQTYPNIQDGQELQIAGYGIINTDDKTYFATNVRPAYRAKLWTISRERCVDLMASYNFNAGDEKIDYDRMICAHNEYADTCSGDSGGPLVIKGYDPSQDILVGLSSWGPRFQCESTDQTQAPSAFVRISYYTNWISQNIVKHSWQNNNFESSYDYQSDNGNSDIVENGNYYSNGGEESTTIPANGGSYSDNGGSHSENGDSHSENGGSYSDNGGSHSENGDSHSENGGSYSDNGGSHSENGDSHSENGGSSEYNNPYSDNGEGNEVEPFPTPPDSGATNGALVLSEEAGRADCGVVVRECMPSLKQDCCESVDFNSVKVGQTCTSTRREYSYQGLCSNKQNAVYITQNRRSSLSVGCTCTI